MSIDNLGARSWFGFVPVGQGPIFLDDVICTGAESAITECSHDTPTNHNCGHSENIAVLCLPNQGIINTTAELS